MTEPSKQARKAVEAANTTYQALRKLMIEHLRDHPDIKRTHSFYALPTSIRAQLKEPTHED